MRKKGVNEIDKNGVALYDYDGDLTTHLSIIENVLLPFLRKELQNALLKKRI